ncbi:MAG: TatD family hydrolase [Conexivisphaerales archaeon]
MPSEGVPAEAHGPSRPLIDAHAHIWASPTASWQRRPPGLTVLLNSTGMDDLESTWERATGDRPGSLLFAGLHPTNPNRDIVAFGRWVESHAAEVDGVGEIGLDRRVSLAESRGDFLTQMELASRLKKPVTVHTRGRLQEALDDLSTFDLRVLLHWFEGSLKELESCTDRGYFVSFGPPLLYSKKIKKLLAAAEMGSLLLETDSPVRYGACFESRDSSPLLIASVYLEAARIMKVQPRELERLLDRNAASFLGRAVGGRLALQEE